MDYLESLKDFTKMKVLIELSENMIKCMSKDAIGAEILKWANSLGIFELPDENIGSNKDPVLWVKSNKDDFEATIKKLIKSHRGKNTLIWILDHILKKKPEFVNAEEPGIKEIKAITSKLEYPVIDDIEARLSKIDNLLKPSQTDAFSSLEETNINRTSEEDNSKMLKDVPPFYGLSQGSRWDEWCFIIEEISSRTKVTDSNLMCLLLPKLRGMALQEYRNLKRDSSSWSNVSWNELRAHFNKLFIDDDEQRRLRDQLRAFCKSNIKPIDAYIEEFVKLKSRIANIPEQEYIDLFIDGLNSKYKVNVRAQKKVIYIIIKNIHSDFGEI
jgi:hypothetical protein